MELKTKKYIQLGEKHNKVNNKKIFKAENYSISEFINAINSNRPIFSIFDLREMISFWDFLTGKGDKILNNRIGKYMKRLDEHYQARINRLIDDDKPSLKK